MSFGLDAFLAASAELDLVLREGTGLIKSDAHALEGVLDGHRVAIRQIHGQWVFVDFEAFFDPPADLQLHIAPEGAISKVKAFFGRHDIEVGDREFDAAFDIKAHEPERALALLTPALRAALLPWRNAGTFHVDDRGIHLSVTVGSYYTPPEAQLLVQNGRAIAQLARAFTTAFDAVPPARALAPHVEAWRAFARERGLQFHASPLRVAGALARPGYRGEAAVPFVARAVPVGDGYTVEIRVRLESPPPFLLRVRPAHWYDFGDRQQVKTGDPAFDEALQVTTDAPDAATRLLDADLRQALLSLRSAHGAVALEDGELAVHTRDMIAPADFGEVIDLVAGVARALRVA